MINIFRDFFKQRKRSFQKRGKKSNIPQQEVLNGIKRQFEEHLQAINENTNEIQSNYEYLSEMESKINKMAERIDQIQLFLQSNNNFAVD